jgi:hypothetical protein
MLRARTSSRPTLHRLSLKIHRSLRKPRQVQQLFPRIRLLSCSACRISSWTSFTIPLKPIQPHFLKLVGSALLLACAAKINIRIKIETASSNLCSELLICLTWLMLHESTESTVAPSNNEAQWKQPFGHRQQGQLLGQAEWGVRTRTTARWGGPKQEAERKATNESIREDARCWRRGAVWSGKGKMLISHVPYFRGACRKWLHFLREYIRYGTPNRYQYRTCTTMGKKWPPTFSKIEETRNWPW